MNKYKNSSKTPRKQDISGAVQKTTTEVVKYCNPLILAQREAAVIHVEGEMEASRCPYEIKTFTVSYGFSSL